MTDFFMADKNSLLPQSMSIIQKASKNKLLGTRFLRDRLHFRSTENKYS